MSNFSAVIALSTCPSREVAETISRALISERLAACVNEIPGVTSTYSWQGELHRDTETLLVIKTQAEQLPAIERRLKELHPYELPEFIVVGVCGGSAPYLEWIRQNVGPLDPNSARIMNLAMKRSALLLCRAILMALCLGSVFATIEAAEQTSSASKGIAGLIKPSGGDDFLPPDEAFKVSVESVRVDAVEITWDIAPEYYLYKKRFAFSAADAPVQLGTPEFPKGEMKNDEFFGEQEVFHESVTVKIPVARAGTEATTFPLKVTYQGCAEAGLCYSPMSKTLNISLPKAGGTASTSQGGAVSEQDRLAQLLRDGNLALVLSTFFGLGVLLSFTPCVLPMVPILSGIIVGQGDRMTPSRGFSLAFTYVQGMALTYAGAAVLFVSAFNQAPQAFFQKPWIVGSFAALFVILAIAMFGAFTLQLPSALQTRLTNVSNQQKSGTFVGTFLMGALSALVVTACVAPAIIAALSVIAQTGAIARGAGALYSMGLGMGVPVMVVGASAGKLLPKVGPWMDTVKSLFGVLFLGMAIYLLSSLLPGAVVMALWAALAIVSGFWIFSLRVRAGEPAPAAVRGIGLLILVYGVLLLIGAGSGRTDPLQPLQGLGTASRTNSPSVSAEAALPFKRIKTVADLDRELAAAKTAGKPVMVDFYADWCVSCKEMEKYTFSKPEIRQALSSAVLLQADVTANDEADRALLQRFGIFGPPTIAFFNAQGEERHDYRVVGYLSAEKFKEQISAAFGSQS